MKKRLLSLLLLTAMIFSFCSCGSTDNRSDETEQSLIMISDPETFDNIDEEKNDKSNYDIDEKSYEDNTESSEESYNDQNDDTDTYDTVEFPMLNSLENTDKQPHFIYSDHAVRIKDKITVTPIDVYYDDYHLTAKCLIYNGYSYNAAKIYADWISLQDSAGEVASDTFGELKNLTIFPGQVETWTFSFDFKDIKNLKSSLTSLKCEYYCHCELEKTHQEIMRESRERNLLIPEPDNTFFNYKDIKTAENEISFTPARIYYENDNLVICFFVHNGFNVNVCNVDLCWFRLYTDEGLIAEYHLDKMKNTVIPAGDYILYQFKIPYEGIKVYNANLRTSISCNNFYRYDTV